MIRYGRKVLLTGFDAKDSNIHLLLEKLTEGLVSDPRNIGIVPTYVPSEEDLSRVLKSNDIGLAVVAYDSGWIESYKHYQQVLSRLAQSKVPVLLFYREADTGVVRDLSAGVKIDDVILMPAIRMPARFTPSGQSDLQGAHFIGGAIKVIRQMVHTEIRRDYTHLGFVGPGHIGEQFLHKAAESILRGQVKSQKDVYHLYVAGKNPERTERIVESSPKDVYHLYVAGKNPERTERIVESVRQYLRELRGRLAEAENGLPVVRIKSSSLEEIAASCSITFDTAGNHERERALFRAAQERKEKVHRDSLLAITLPSLLERAEAFRYAPGKVIVFTNPVSGALCAYAGEALRGVSDQEEIKSIMDRFEGSVAVDHLRGARILEEWSKRLIDLPKDDPPKIDLRLVGMHGDDFVVAKANIQGAKLDALVETRLEELEFRKSHASEDEGKILEKDKEEIRSMTTERLRTLMIERGIGPDAIENGRLVGEAAAALQTHFFAIMTQDPQPLPVMRFTDPCENSTVDRSVKVKIPGRMEDEEIGRYLESSFLLGRVPMTTYRRHDVFSGAQEKVDITTSKQLENLLCYIDGFRTRFISEMRRMNKEEGLDVSHLLRLFNVE